MDLLQTALLSAHAQSAAALDRNAEFQAAVAEFFQSLGEHSQAARARETAEVHRQLASRERGYALAAVEATGRRVAA